MSRLRILLSGMIAGVPDQGGAVWATLQWALGLRELGHDVHLVEPIRGDELEPAGAPLAASRNAAYFRRVVTEFGIEQDATLLHEGTGETVGRTHRELVAFARQADVLVNTSGLLRDEEVLGAVPRRVWLDLDPAFNQLWHEVEGIDMHFAGHTHFVTVGLRMGSPDCAAPTCGRQWHTTLPPVVLSSWRVAPVNPRGPFTTVARWRAYGSIEHNGVRFGQKAHALRPLVEVPKRSGAEFLLALDIHRDEQRDLAALRAGGWSLVDPRRAAGTTAAYRRFICGSAAEFGVAKEGYVASRCGWFSDRSACYLASGRPVLAHDTGFTDHLPAGDGLIPFRDADDVLEGVARLRADYSRHARAARQIAEEHFDSARVLPRVLERVGAAA